MFVSRIVFAEVSEEERCDLCAQRKGSGCEFLGMKIVEDTP